MFCTGISIEQSALENLLVYLRLLKSKTYEHIKNSLGHPNVKVSWCDQHDKGNQNLKMTITDSI